MGMKYKVYYTKLRKISELVDQRNPDSPHYHTVELVYVGDANSMAEAKLITACPILESLK
jgi:hypothetical protein